MDAKNFKRFNVRRLGADLVSTLCISCAWAREAAR
jgi:hypothetical protein